MTAAQRIVLWNSAGFRAGTSSTSSKFSFLDSPFLNASFSIAALVETYHKDGRYFSSDLCQFQKTHNIIHSLVGKETQSGIIVLISRDFEIIDETETIPGRLFNVKLKRANKTLNLSIFHGPQWAKLDKNEINDTIAKFDTIHGPSDNNIIMGDFNFAEFDIDKAKGMDSRDKFIKPLWYNFLSTSAIIDPFRVQ